MIDAIMRKMDLRDRFEHIALTQPERKAIQAKREDSWFEISYHELREKILSLATWMGQKGIEKGDRVAIILDNRPEWPLIFFSTIYSGAVSVPIYPESPGKEIKNILKNSECKIIFTKEDSFLLDEDASHIISVDSHIFKEIIAKKAKEEEIR